MFSLRQLTVVAWVPAFAGMTIRGGLAPNPIYQILEMGLCATSGVSPVAPCSRASARNEATRQRPAGGAGCPRKERARERKPQRLSTESKSCGFRSRTPRDSAPMRS